MKRFMIDYEEVVIPNWVVDLESFRRWTDDDAYPEYGRISFIQGEVWIDMSKEQLFTHNGIKTEITIVLGGLIRRGRLGRYFSDEAFISNVEADVSNQPDGMFVSAESIRRGRVRVVESRGEGQVELEGTPDMVLEVVSPSSVRKDTQVLRAAYAVAGIPEYWLVDARHGSVSFSLLVLKGAAYRAARKREDWSFSPVFNRWFRLFGDAGDDGFAELTLQARDERP